MNLQNTVLSDCSAENVCGTSNGTISVTASPSPVVSTTGTIGYVNSSFSGATVVITGTVAADNNNSATITFLDDPCTLTNGASNIQISAFTTSTGTPINLDATGAATFDIGATVTIPTNTTIGTYNRSGNCRVRVRRVTAGGGRTSIIQLETTLVVQNGIAPGTISVSQTTPLNFGMIAPDAGASSIVLDRTTDVRAVTVGSSTIMGFHTLGEFSVANANLAPMLLAVSATNTTLTGPGTPIPLTLAPPPSVSVPGRTGIVPGVNTFKVGGQIDINAGQAEGTYTGTYTITVDF